MSELRSSVKAIVFFLGGATSVVFKAVGVIYHQLVLVIDVHDKRGRLLDHYL